MKVSVIGLGYVGLVTSACLAEWGHDVLGADNNRRRLDALLRGAAPFHEPGLDAMVADNLERRRLRFTASATQAARDGDAVIVAVGTHDGNGGWQTLTIQSCLADIVPEMPDDAPLIIRSTMPPDFIRRMALIARAIRSEAGRKPVPVMLNPEFTREGSAIRDFMHPERVVFGSVDDPDGHGLRTLQELYANVTAPMLSMSAMDAAFAKLGANLFLATKISFANELAALCDAYGAHVDNVVQAMGHDPRIGPTFLRAGVGFGGSCLPHQVSMTVRDADRDGIDSPLLDAVNRINHRQRLDLVQHLARMVGQLEGQRVALLGLTFKPHTDDLRDAPSLTVAAELLAAGATVVAYDPMPSARARAIELVPDLVVADDVYAALANASAAALVTEWPEFLQIDWSRAAEAVRRRIIFDGRNALDPSQLRAAGFTYSAFGRMVTGQVAAMEPVQMAMPSGREGRGAGRRTSSRRRRALARVDPESAA